MPELVGLPDVETALIAYHKPLAGGVKVANAVPADRPNDLIVLERTGGQTPNRVTDQPYITYQVWSDTKTKAFILASKVFAQVCATPERSLSVSVRRVLTVGGLVNFPDPDTRNPRYQFTVALDVARPILES
jgi:hypothetical protein